MFVLSGRIRSTFTGFSKLIYLYHQVSSSEDSIIEIDLSGVSWFDANMCAPFGAVLSQSRGLRPIRIVGMNPEIESILEKNGFLPNYGFNRPKTVDLYKTTIEYQRFDSTDSSSFKGYVTRHFVKRKGIPKMSRALASKFRESIAEIFDNAVEHSETKLGIFACGQYFPRSKRLYFSIADLGIGIRSRVNSKKSMNLDAVQAIQWALSESNTTKTDKPGGFGLKMILNEFIRLNEGKLSIISDNGYLLFHKGKIEKRPFENPFPGTVVNIEINTGDRKAYCFKSEIDPDTIF